MILFFYSSQLIRKNLANNEDFNLPPKFVIHFEKPELHALTLSFLCILSEQVHLVELLLFWELLLL